MGESREPEATGEAAPSTSGRGDDPVFRREWQFALGIGSIVVLVLMVLGGSSKLAQTIEDRAELVRGESLTFRDLEMWTESERHFVPGDSVDIRVGLRNLGASPVSARVESDRDGIPVDGSCWRGMDLVCVDRRVGVDPDDFGWTLSPGSSLVLRGQLRAGALATARVRVLLRVEAPALDVAEPPDSPRFLEAELPLPGEPVARLDGFWQLLAQFIYEFAKDFGLPIVGAVLGFWFAHRVDAQRLRQQEASEREARVRESWNQMLPRVHSNAERFYMPISSALQGFRQEFDRLIAAAREEERLPRDEQVLDKLLLHLVQLFCRHNHLNQEIGGYYFKSRAAEAAVAKGWHVLRDRTIERPTERVLDRDRFRCKIPFETHAVLVEEFGSDVTGSSWNR